MFWQNLSQKEKASLLTTIFLLLTLPLLAILIRYQQEQRVRGAAPQGASIVINQGAAYTNTVQVNLRLTAPAQLNNAGQQGYVMQIANQANFEDAQTEPFAAAREWRLTNDNGVKTVYARFALVKKEKPSGGDAGKIKNWTQPVSDTIVLDTTPPDTQIISGPAEGETISQPEAEFKVSAN